MLNVAFENITNYGVNFGFAKHVLSMDTTFGTNMWKAVPANSDLIHLTYSVIIIVETIASALCWFGFVRMLQNFKSNFVSAK